MKISFKGDYAIKIILDLSINYGNDRIQIKDISKRQDIPFKYLQQLVLQLRDAGYIKTKKGAKGGISLAKPPKNITLGEIIEVVEGTLSPIACINNLSPVNCKDVNNCVLRPIWIKVKNAIENIVNDITFEELAKKFATIESNYSYVI